MNANANMRSSVDSNSPLLNKPAAAADKNAAAEKGGASGKNASSGKDVEAQKNEARSKLNPKHPVSSIPFSMNQW